MIDTLSTAFGLNRALRHLDFIEGLLPRQGWRVHFSVSDGTVFATEDFLSGLSSVRHGSGACKFVG